MKKTLSTFCLSTYCTFDLMFSTFFYCISFFSHILWASYLALMFVNNEFRLLIMNWILLVYIFLFYSNFLRCPPYVQGSNLMSLVHPYMSPYYFDMYVRNFSKIFIFCRIFMVDLVSSAMLWILRRAFHKNRHAKKIVLRIFIICFN